MRVLLFLIVFCFVRFSFCLLEAFFFLKGDGGRVDLRKKGGGVGRGVEG